MDLNKKYYPQSVHECILPSDLKARSRLARWVKDPSKLPNMVLFYGPKGTGKTTFAECLIDHLDLPKGYLDRWDAKGGFSRKMLDTIETRIRYRIDKDQKYVVFLDELKAETPTEIDFCEGLRSLYNIYCGKFNIHFIATTNYPEQIRAVGKGSVWDRFTVLPFESFDAQDVIGLLTNIAKQEGILASRDDISDYWEEYFPKLRLAIKDLDDLEE
ncbi:hypothetical protein DF3PA_70114 [Candidatus Defluviicoccus seviourii]|uniref:ATPase AAA-type core domain-containing protein n=1 Tax=Candidatus Defluviicoccus seviourii TaxID=2565273 RepID=A0A564WJL1_9PROT|nr:hypothetical protein DF3PA_70114 [Candidatus Defluviicoccus seviourii]